MGLYTSVLANSPHLCILVHYQTKEVCSVAIKTHFKCNVYKNGKLISKNVGGA
jgi:hypothetical protein